MGANQANSSAGSNMLALANVARISGDVSFRLIFARISICMLAGKSEDNDREAELIRTYPSSRRKSCESMHLNPNTLNPKGDPKP